MSDSVKLGDALAFVRQPHMVANELPEALRTASAETLYARAAERATRLGLNLDSILERDAQRLSEFPTRECLTPSEVASRVAEEPLDAARVQHATTCEYCARIVRAAHPTEEQRERFLDEIASLAPRAGSAISTKKEPAAAK